MKKMLEIYLGFSSLEHPHRPMLIKKIKEYSPDSILELGCGYGPNLILLRKEMPNVKGIDIDEMAIVKGRELGLLPKEISTGEAENLSGYKDNSIDVVFSDAVLMYVKDIKKVIQEMLRISKKGLILVEWHAEEDNYNSHIGNWTRNYRKILEQFVSPEQIEITKITKEEWPNKDWIKNGYLINVTL